LVSSEMPFYEPKTDAWLTLDSRWMIAEQKGSGGSGLRLRASGSVSLLEQTSRLLLLTVLF